MINNKVPKRRFKGFTDDWEQRKAKELCNISTGKSNTQDQMLDGKYPFFIRSDIPVRSSKFLYDEEAVITIGDGNIGKVFHYINGKFDLHQRCYKMSSFKELEAKYFYYFFSRNFYKRAISMTAKATVDSVRLEMISDMDILYPSKIEEQTKISSYLTNIDNLITLHQRKLKKLVDLKSSYLEKMFPTNNKNIPDLRFKEFDYEWEQISLGEILSYEQPDKYIVKNDNYSDSYTIPVLTAGQSLLLGYTNEVNNIKKGSHSPVIIFDDFTTSSHYINYDFKIKSSAMKLLSSKSNSNLYFSSLLLKNIKYEVMNHGRHWISIYSSLNVKSPKYKEQHQIGNFFSKIDNIIELQNKKLEKLKNLKQAYLNEMFVN